MNETVDQEICDESYNKSIENIKLLLQLLYLVPSSLFQLRVIYIISWKFQKKYRKQSFFLIFAADCVTGLLLILISIFFSRPLIYLPQFCHPFQQFLESHLLLLDIYYPLLRYLQAFQILLQMLFIANRASCVIYPMDYGSFWKKWLKTILWVLSALPFLWIWTIIVSDKKVKHVYGGLFVTYSRYFSWAQTSLFFALIRGTSVIFIGLSTPITVIKMANMKNRIKKSERRLCWASVYLSICYIIPAVAEFQYSISNKTITSSSPLYAIIVISWDIQNIGSTFVMLIMNSEFRKLVFESKNYEIWEGKKKKIIQVTSITLNKL